MLNTLHLLSDKLDGKEMIEKTPEVSFFIKVPGSRFGSYRETSSRFSAFAYTVGSKKQAVFLFIQGACRQREHRLRRVFFPGDKPVAVEF
ncbi:hypothetical protein SAMN05216417_1246 [Nitrosospira multiformis]|uniref:Uncharacterized protein n=1 Tax=Nitrosospira multiformis TaxID=1231 RepID=A0A1I7IQY2_9PROT|nr:hypothetical protein SAMN05216417_1246 [Nitrosospira multiformis]